MDRIAYIQSDDSGSPYSVNGAVAARGFAVLGYDVRYFLPADLAQTPLTPETVVVGGMGTVRAALEQIGIQPPSHASAPPVLQPYLGRKSWRTTFRDVREAGLFPVFLKPYEEAKVFTGRVVSGTSDLQRMLQPQQGFPMLTEDFPLLAQDPVCFLSEWRVFVVRGEVVGVSHYAGDALAFPAPGTIRIALGAYQGAPAGYSADFGVTDDGRTLLVETNDGYSLGHRGLVANLYADLLRSRWEEMTNRAEDRKQHRKQ